jgi:carbon monoxide dehydrogenase subunit G
MKISGSSVLHASPDRVWAAVTDPAVLSAVIPGCDVLTPTAANTFALTVTLGVASIKGSYTGEVSFSDLVEPSSLTMRAKGSGGPGTIDTTVAVVLTGLSDGSTRLDYDADAMVGGMVGGVGQRVLAGVAKKTAGVFFAAIDEVLTGTRPLADAAVPTAAAAPAAAPAPISPHPSPQRAYSLIGAAAFGAISMLVGVLVGARITGRATRARRQ